MRDLGFFLREAYKGLKLHPAANLVSVVSIALALLSLTLVVGGWANLENALETTRSQAEIVVYLGEEIGAEGAQDLADRLISEAGATRVRVVTPEETVGKVEAVIGSDFDILEVMEGFNPFTYSVEVGVDPNEASYVASLARAMAGVDSVRDNEEILAPLVTLTAVARWAGLAASIAVAFVTLILVSHIVRLGISARREEIETLRLLGATAWFVAVPFLLEGGILGMLGALVCLAVAIPGGPLLYAFLGESIPFLPLVPWGNLAGMLAAVVSTLGTLAGLLGAGVAVRSRV